MLELYRSEWRNVNIGTTSSAMELKKHRGVDQRQQAHKANEINMKI